MNMNLTLAEAMGVTVAWDDVFSYADAIAHNYLVGQGDLDEDTLIDVVADHFDLDVNDENDYDWVSRIVMRVADRYA